VWARVLELKVGAVVGCELLPKEVIERGYTGLWLTITIGHVTNCFYVQTNTSLTERLRFMLDYILP
jgi:hypothetical protein